MKTQTHTQIINTNTNMDKLANKTLKYIDNYTNTQK